MLSVRRLSFRLSGSSDGSTFLRVAARRLEANAFRAALGAGLLTSSHRRLKISITTILGCQPEDAWTCCLGRQEILSQRVVSSMRWLGQCFRKSQGNDSAP